MGALASLYLLNGIQSDGDCIGYSSHWCDKLSAHSLREKGLGFGLQFREDTVHRGGEGVVAGTGLLVTLHWQSRSRESERR